jgi:two-component system CheB/CheR fusion protein
MDMKADEFMRQSRRVFSPEAMGFVFLAAIASAAGIIALWQHRRVAVLNRINMERSGLLRLTFHQLGEPLTIMKWSLESLREETENVELKKLVEEHVACMDEGLGRLNSIIDTLQLAEKVDLNTLEYLPVPSSLRALIDNAVEEWSSSLHSHDITMAIQMAEDIQMPIDKTLLLIVFRQILVNAIEYSNPASTITIDVKKGNASVEIMVRDTGCGIPAKDMEHLFEKYRRASNAPLKKPDGNGLGLYIAKGIIEKAGGHIWVESWLKKGTAVHFTLPLQHD